MRRIAAVLLVMLALAPLALAGPSVSRQIFALDVVGREPANADQTFPSDVGRVYCFTQIVDIGPEANIFHVWIYDGKEVATVPLTVEGWSWRTWSNKYILPHQTGEWTVEVRDIQAAVLATAAFTVE